MSPLPKQHAIFLNERMLHSGLLEQAQATLLKKLETAPDEENYLERLADLYRQQGKLAQAGHVYQRWANANPQSKKVAYLTGLFNHHILQGELPGEGISAAPFYIEENFLSQEFHDDLFRFAKASAAQFTASGVQYSLPAGEQKKFLDANKRSSRQIPLGPDINN